MTSSPTPLIPLLDQYYSDPAVSARALYSFLQLNPSNYARWTRLNILESSTAVENVDWIHFSPTLPDEENSEGRPAQDFALSLDFAKMLAMMARSERGHRAREYFLACERAALQALRSSTAIVPVAPANYPAALRALADAEEAKAAMEAQVILMEPKAALFDRAMDSADLLDMLEVPRVLNLSYGRTRLFELLREAEVIMRGSRLPYQRWMEVQPPYFRVVENVFTDERGVTHVQAKTLVTQRGLDFIDRKLGEMGGR